MDFSRRLGSDGLPEISRSEPGIVSSWVVCISLVLQFCDRSWSLTDYIHITNFPVSERWKFSAILSFSLTQGGIYYGGCILRTAHP